MGTAGNPESLRKSDDLPDWEEEMFCEKLLETVREEYAALGYPDTHVRYMDDAVVRGLDGNIAEYRKCVAVTFIHRGEPYSTSVMDEPLETVRGVVRAGLEDFLRMHP